MAFSGTQITRLGVSGVPRQLYGSFVKAIIVAERIFVAASDSPLINIGVTDSPLINIGVTDSPLTNVTGADT